MARAALCRSAAAWCAARSSRSESAVKPARSAKATATCLRRPLAANSSAEPAPRRGRSSRASRVRTGARVVAIASPAAIAPACGERPSRSASFCTTIHSSITRAKTVAMAKARCAAIRRTRSAWAAARAPRHRDEEAGHQQAREDGRAERGGHHGQVVSGQAGEQAGAADGEDREHGEAGRADGGEEPRGQQESRRRPVRAAGAPGGGRGTRGLQLLDRANEHQERRQEGDERPAHQRRLEGARARGEGWSASGPSAPAPVSSRPAMASRRPPRRGASPG